MFGPDTRIFIDPVSVPFTVFRNRQKYVLQNTISSHAKDRSTFRVRAENQTKYYKGNTSESDIPSSLLYDYVLEDCLHMRKYYNSLNSLNTILGLNCDGTNLCAYVSGRQFDQIMLRYTDEFQPCISQDVSSFVLNLDSEIIQLEKFGMSSYNTVTDFIARSATEIFHIRPIHVGDYQPHMKKAPATLSCNEAMSNAVILDPVQKWRINATIACFSSSKSSSSYGRLLTDTCQLYSLDPLYGFNVHSNDNIFPSTCDVHTALPISSTHDHQMSLECTLHPQISFLSCNRMLLQKDTRLKGCATPLIILPEPVHSVLAHGSNLNLCVVGHPLATLIIDTRYTRKCLSQRPVSQPHDLMSFVSKSSFDGIDGIESGIVYYFLHTTYDLFLYLCAYRSRYYFGSE